MDPKDQQLRARSRAAPGGKPLFYGRSAPSQVRHSITEGLHTWILSSPSPQELQSRDRKRGQGHRAAPTFNTTMIKSPLHFKSNKWRPLPARYPSAFEAFPPAEPKPPSGLSTSLRYPPPPPTKISCLHSPALQGSLARVF